MSSLKFIKEVDQTSAVSTIQLNDVFIEGTEVYKVVLDNFSTSGTTHEDINIRFGAGGALNVYGYEHAFYRIYYHGAHTEHRDTGANKIFCGMIDQAPEGGGGYFYVFNTAASEHTYVYGQFASRRNGGGQTHYYVGFTNRELKFTDLGIVGVNNRPFTGKVTVYGLKT